MKMRWGRIGSASHNLTVSESKHAFLMLIFFACTFFAQLSLHVRVCVRVRFCLIAGYVARALAGEESDEEDVEESGSSSDEILIDDATEQSQSHEEDAP